MKIKKRIGSIILAFSLIFSTVGIHSISYAESNENASSSQVIESVSVEKISASEGAKVFDSSSAEGSSTEATEGSNTEATEGSNTEATEGSNTEATEDSNTEATEDSNTEATEGSNTEATEGSNTEATEGDKTIVIGGDGQPDRNIKDGDFWVQIQEAIKDTAGNIVGWIDGIINGDNGWINDDDTWKSDLDIEEGKYEPIEAQEDGSGKWTSTIVPDADGTSYYKVTEATYYQEREILGTIYEEDGVTISHYIEGELLFNDDGTPKMSNKKLPGVTYDDTIYYLKYEDGELSEVRVVIPGAEDPFKDLGSFDKEYIKNITDNSNISNDDPQTVMDYLVEYIQNDKNIAGVKEDEFKAAGEKYNIDSPLSFNNDFDLPTGEVDLEGNKNLTGKDLENGEFEFVVKDKDGNIIGNATNDKNGNFVINIPVDHEGEFEYIIEENKGTNLNIEYDGTIYIAKIKVTYDRLTNKLISELVYMDKDGNILDPEKLPEFSNKYTPPTDPKEPPTDPKEPPTDPKEPPTDPKEPPTDPKEPPTDPKEPPTDPKEPPTDPKEPPTDPKEPPTDLKKPESSTVEEFEEAVVEVPTIPLLPKTGVQGLAAFTVSGGSLIAIGAWVLRKKK